MLFVICYPLFQFSVDDFGFADNKSAIYFGVAAVHNDPLAKSRNLEFMFGMQRDLTFSVHFRGGMKASYAGDIYSIIAVHGIFLIFHFTFLDIEVIFTIE